MTTQPFTGLIMWPAMSRTAIYDGPIVNCMTTAETNHTEAHVHGAS